MVYKSMDLKLLLQRKSSSSKQHAISRVWDGLEELVAGASDKLARVQCPVIRAGSR
jgi:hypothetical protein